MADGHGRTRRAVVLARGLGTRMRDAGRHARVSDAQAAAADAGQKVMMPFGRPFLDYVLHALADAGVGDVALVLGPEHESARDYYRGLGLSRLRLSFVEQAEALGTADAVWSARDWVDHEPFIVLNGDNLYPVDALMRLVEGSRPAAPGFARDALLLSLERIASFALIETDATGRLVRIVEKPGTDAIRSAGPEALISMNLWRFDERILDACRDVPLSARGERELPHAVQLAVDRGVPFDVIPVRGAVLDLSRRDDIPRVATELEGRSVRL